MAKFSVERVSMLVQGYKLTPERYTVSQEVFEETSVLLRDLCEISKEAITPKKANSAFSYLILDTGDVKEGFIKNKAVVSSEEIGSTKKVLRAGDVIISRLRPYLRQVGYVDKDFIDKQPNNTIVACSTEFYVLRSSSDISYLAPLLLTVKSQEILCQSQEGGHHPRFNKDVLESLVFNEKEMENKISISKQFKEAIFFLRKGESQIQNLLLKVNST